MGANGKIASAIDFGDEADDRVPLRGTRGGVDRTGKTPQQEPAAAEIADESITAPIAAVGGRVEERAVTALGLALQARGHGGAEQAIVEGV